VESLASTHEYVIMRVADGFIIDLVAERTLHVADGCIIDIVAEST
jgi:hypothetical protein